MANYKVPQDVEADDKLLGPFSFRQFVYLLVVAAGVGIGFVLFKILPPLVIIPLPIVIFFGALALPLRKDQPMEVYLAAILSYHLKQRKRTWDPDGIETLVQITAPRTSEPVRTKSVSGNEAEQRLRYLADLSDSRGWSVRGVYGQPATSMNTDVFNEAQQAEDVLDDTNTIARNLDHMISQSDQRRHQEMLNQFQTAAATPQAPPQWQVPDPYAMLTSPSIPMAPPAPIQQVVAAPAPTSFDAIPAPQFNPYPTSMNQSVIQPLSGQPQPQPQPQIQPLPQPQTPAPVAVAPTPEPTTTSAKPLSPDIMKLASNADLSIETIAREANRINQKEASISNGEEVIISLR